MENNTQEILRVMDQKLEGIPQEKLLFFKVDELRRNITRLGKYAPGCEVCDHFFPEAEGMAERIGDALAVQGEDRRELDRLIFRLSNHMMKEHGFYPVNHFSFRCSMWGIFLGLAAGYLLEKLVLAPEYWLPATGLILGLFTGQILGRLRDRRIHSAQMSM
jgi:hypothetical protein